MDPRRSYDYAVYELIRCTAEIAAVRYSKGSVRPQVQPKQSCQRVGVELHSSIASELVDQPSPLLRPTAPPPPATTDVHLTLVEQAILL
jgi:hypothetical protein